MSPRPRPTRARRARGLTLVEILIVMAIIVLVTGGVILGTGQLASARLKHSSTMIAGAVRVAFSRATATSKSVRIVFDLDQQTMWLEEGNLPMLVQAKDATGTGGAEAKTAAEQAAIAEGDRIVKGPKAPRPNFTPIDAPGVTSGGQKGPKSLALGIKFREVETAHDDAPRTTGRAYLYFWPGGMTERASIQLRVGDSTEDQDTMSLLVAPLTGKVTAKDGPVAVKRPVDDKEASDREDPGGF
jgi:general secretion pathway protein H